MDQLKDVLKKTGDFLWTYRFWLSLGLVTVFAFVTYPSGSQTLQLRAKQRMQQLNGVFTNVDKFRNGQDFPNPEWVQAADKKKQEVGVVVEDAWESLYKKQEKLMTWPEDVSEKFAGKPFGSDLTTKEDRSKFLIKYSRSFSDYVLDTFAQLGAMDYDDDNKVTGVVDANIGVLRRAVWTRPPTSIEAWLAQEQLWVQRALFKAIAEANKGSETWSKAPVRGLNAIAVGTGSLDSKLRQEAKQLVDYTGQATQGAASTLTTGQNLDPVRYLEKNPQFRTIPVFVSLMVDQHQIPRVLSILSSADFAFTISQTNVSVPDKYQVPTILRESGSLGDRGGREDPVYNAFQVDVWGQMRIYEMPPKMKAAYDEKNAAAGAPPGATPPPGQAPPPTANPQAGVDPG